MQLGHAGLNHLTWIRSVQVDGEDVLPALLRNHGDEIAAHVELPRRIIDNLGAVPSYYLRYYYQHDLVVQELLESRSRAEEVMEVERELLELYRDPQLHDKPDLLMQRGGAYYSEAALNLLGSLFGDSPDVQVVDVQQQRDHPGAARGRRDRGARAGGRRRGRNRFRSRRCPRTRRV